MLRHICAGCAGAPADCWQATAVGYTSAGGAVVAAAAAGCAREVSAGVQAAGTSAAPCSPRSSCPRLQQQTGATMTRQTSYALVCASLERTKHAHQHVQGG